MTGAGGTLGGSGLSGGDGGVYSLTGTASQITAQLEALTFKPARGAPGTSSTTSFTLTDASATDTNTSVTDVEAAAPPVLVGGGHTATTSEASVLPFAEASLVDPNPGSTDTLTIQASGVGGLLTGAGLSGGTGGLYSLTGTDAQVTSALRQLSFTPTAGQPATTSSTSFALDATSTATTSTMSTTTTVTNTDPAQPPQSLSGIILMFYRAFAP